jgi:tetratricopeptide (TPR) repeat protein
VIRLSGVLASILGRPNEAIEILRRALEHDPLSAAAYHSLGVALHVVDDFAGASDAFRKALDLAPQRIATHGHLALTVLARGRPEEALVEASHEPEEGYRLWALAIIHHALGDERESDAALQRLIDEHAGGWALQVAEVRAARGEVDAAFEWLDRAHTVRDTGLANVKTNPRLRALHGEQRWDAFLGKMQARHYRTLRGETIDGEVKWTETAITQMQPKSFLARVTKTAAGYNVLGVVLHDGTPIKTVEVRVDDGPWQPATLDPATRAKYSWKLFNYAWNDAKPGEHTLVSRVTDAMGRVQPTLEDLESKKTFLEDNSQYPRKIVIG